MIGEVRVLSIFVGEERILPIQYMPPREYDSPALRFYRAVVFDAVHDLCREMTYPRRRRWYARPILRDLVTWITGGPATVPYATAMALGFPNLDADAVADQLLRIVGLQRSGDHLVTLVRPADVPLVRMKFTRRELVRRQRRTR